MDTIKLTNGELKIKYYNSNLEAFFNGECTNYSFDGDLDYTTEENINSFIDEYLEGNLNMNLTSEDIEKLHFELHAIFYAHSSEVIL